MAEISIEIDGIYCPQCRDFHPVLYWHDKYDEYLMNRREQWERMKRRFPSMYIDAEYVDDLPKMGLVESLEAQECVVCHADTHFLCLGENIPICCNECMAAYRGEV